jgi:hypothetical protein
LRSLVRCDRTQSAYYHNIPMKKYFLSLLLPFVQAMRYYNPSENSKICQTKNQFYPQSKLGSNRDGNQGRPSKSVSPSRSLLTQCSSYTALTKIPRSLLKFSNTLSHYWQSSKNNSLALLQVAEGRPLTNLKTVGVIWMISNISMPVKRSGEWFSLSKKDLSLLLKRMGGVREPN